MKAHEAEPNKQLIPKIPNIWPPMALMTVPIIGMVLAGMAMDNAAGSGEGDLWAVVLLLLAIIDIVGLVLYIKAVVSLRMKVSAFSRSIAGSLRRDHGIAVTDPATLVVHDGRKVRLSSDQIQALDAYGRPVTITIKVDETGTKVVPSVHEVRS